MTWIKASRCDSNQCVEVWHKATRSSGNGSCVEVAFHKSTASTDNGTCVEVGACACNEVGEVLVRDSKDKAGPVLRFTGDEWTAFIAGAKAGEFDRTG